MTIRSKVVTGLVILIFLTWWFYPRAPLPLGFTGTAPNPDNIPGARPTVDCFVDTDFMKNVELRINDQIASNSELILPRHKKVRLKGKLDLQDIPEKTQFIAVEISVASKSKNAQGMLIEGETEICFYDPPSWKPEMTLSYDQDWQVPDHQGDFLLLLVFHVVILGERETPRRFAVACPVKIE